MTGMDVNGEGKKESEGSRSPTGGLARSRATAQATARATAKKVAREVGVSPSTVSNAYNSPGELSAELRERVLEAAKRLGYPGPNPLGRGLRRQRTDTVGVLFGNRLSYAFADPVAVRFLEGVSQATEEAGLGLLLLPGASLAGNDSNGDLEAVRGATIDGLVIHNMASDDPLVATALDRRLPTVAVDQPQVEVSAERGDMPSVSVDDEEAARVAADHVLGLGHRRLGVVSSRLALETRSGAADSVRQGAATLRPSGARLEGYALAASAAGIRWDEVPVYECPESTPSEGRAAARELLSRDSKELRPTAILAVSDQLALGVLEAAGELGISVPKELSVVGFDDIPEAGRSSPPLTTISQPHLEKGLRAGRKLVAALVGESPGEQESLQETLPTRLIVRDSTMAAT